MTEAVSRPAIAAMSFEVAMAELDAIVKRLEEGQGRLDEAVELYDRGTALRRHCETKLAEAQLRIDRIVAGANADRPPTTEPFDAQ